MHLYIFKHKIGHHPALYMNLTKDSGHNVSMIYKEECLSSFNDGSWAYQLTA